MIISLDTIRNDLINWADSLWLDGIGAFRNGNSPQPSLKSSLFMTYILYSMDALGVVAIEIAGEVGFNRSKMREMDLLFFPQLHGHATPNGVMLCGMRFEPLIC